MDVFPAYFPLKGRRVVIAGEGEGAEAKARLFADAPAEIVRLNGEAALKAASYKGATLAFIAHADPAFLAQAAAAARKACVPVNVVDRPGLCDFNTPAVIDRGEVVAAVGTGGSAPLLASLLRADIEARVPEGAGWVAALLRKMQIEVRAAFPDLPARRAFLRRVIDGPVAKAAMSGELEEAEALMRAAITAGAAEAGRVRGVPAEGPADGLSLRAARILSEADAVAVDAGADEQVVVLVRRDARRLMGREATLDGMAELAQQGLQIVRLVVGPPPAGLELVR
jgi:precorrin-2 dehydrogenase / sirohydrochlorin ferrochelatase